MRCASCEVLIEKKLSALKEIKSVEASTDKGRVFVTCQGEEPSIYTLNEMFKRESYLFSNQPMENAVEKERSDFFTITGAVLLIIVGFLSLKTAILPV